MKKVIITGATGFIGFNILKELYSEGIEIIAIVRCKTKNLYKLQEYNVRIIECNLDEVDSLPEKILDKDIDAIYHFAWQGVSDNDLKNEEVQIANIKATLKLIDVANKMNIKTFIGAGSLHEAEAIEEMSVNKIISNMGFMYKSAKIAAHYMGKAKAGFYGIRFFWPIVSNTYGAGEVSGRLINTIIRKVLSGQSPDLSAGEQLYDFVHIKDTAKAFRLIGEKGIDGTNYIIGSGNPKPLKEYLKIVGDIANGYRNDDRVELGFGRIKSNVVFLPEAVFDAGDLIRDTGFRTEITFKDGITETVEWIGKNI